MALAPRVAVTESGQGIGYEAPRSNSLLALGGALGELEPTLAGALQGYAKGQEQKAQAKATADALRSSGKAFADAVREGKIEPTQNPWYIRHYEQEAAQVRGQAAASQLYADSQSWAERNDPVKFAERWAREGGEIAKNFQGPDQQAGFQRSFDPISQQALQGNVQYNVQRIQTENTQATTANMVTSIEGVLRVNAKAKPSDFYSALEPQREAWLAIGGTEQQFALMTKGAVTAAAYKADNPGLLDILEDDRGGKGAIANIGNERGGTLAEDIATDRYRITEAANAKLMGDARIMKAQREAAGYRLYNWAYQNLPTDQLVKGDLNFNELVEKFKTATDPQTGQAFTGPAINAALKIIQEEQSSNNSLQRALIDQYSNSPEAGLRIINLQGRVLKEGLTGAVESEIHSAVRNGEIDVGTARSLLNTAQSTSQHFQSEARADARSARSDAKEERRFRLEAEKDTKDYVTRTVGVATAALNGAGSPRLAKDPAFRATFTRQVAGAVDSHLRANPGDYSGAQKAADDAANKLLVPELNKARVAAERRANSAGGGTGNRLRSGGNK